ncbi:MAG: mandelate racemase/muconate lactonizing enzyme family protein, partial [Armatimonadota bacterium]|nr:mandelate racemase/muconate lactonizing enzyme family protein [Armatimonadota bacterium]
ECLEALRATVGEEVDLIVECHGRYPPEWALRLAKEAERFRPLFLEDPVRHENPQALRTLRQHTSIPIATGERAHSKWDFRELVVNGYVDYLRPDVNHCGGISEMKKIAAFAEVYYVSLIPHNTQGPLGMAACLHVAFSTDNVVLVEAGFVNSDHPTNPFANPWPAVEKGFALPPTGPGLGITFDEAAARAAPYTPPRTPYPPQLRGPDGSVRDW